MLEPLADLSLICVAQGRIFFRERSHARVTALVMRADVAADLNYAVEKKMGPPPPNASTLCLNQYGQG